MRVDLFSILMIVPWVATFAGSITAVYISINTQRKQGSLLGFAAGIMIAASIWSLILPAFDEAGTGWFGVALVTGGFVLGCLGMLLLDKLIPHQHNDDSEAEGIHTHMSRSMLLVTAVALHNIPEGMALGVVIASAMSDQGMSWMAALMFGIGLALQNFPEGAAVVLPLRQSGVSRKKCIRLGTLASFAEPVAALVGLLLSSLLIRLGGIIMPLLLSIAAGAMVFIVVEELIPESQSGNVGHSSTYGFLIGFWIMAVMGVVGG